jgi:HAD superfamily hydrolase (TIGR01509 family)
MHSIKGLIFDFDGLILDTELPNLQAWQNVYREFGQELPFDKYVLTVGTDEKAFNPLTYLHQLTGNGFDSREAATLHDKLLFKYISTSDLMPGVRQYLQDAKTAGINVAIASSSTQTWVLGHVERLNCRDYFDAIVTADSIYPAKPDPAVYRVALDQLGIFPKEGIAFEDSVNGVRAARQAEIFCVVVPNSVTVNMDFHESDLQVPSLLTVGLNEIIKIAQSR